MRGKDSFIEKLRRLAQEYERRLPQDEWVKERLRWEDWETLGREAAGFAARELKRRCRLQSGQVLPGGYDAESIAAQAVADLLEGKGRLAAGWTRARLTKELERLISGRIRLLTSLKEGRVTRGGLEAERSNPESELANAVEQVPDGCGTGYDAVVAREAEEGRERLRGEFERFLEGEPELVAVFRCLWAGVTNPAEIGRRVGVEAGAVAALRKRLERRMARFRGRKEQKETERGI